MCKSSGQSDLDVDARNCAERCELFCPAAAPPGATVPLSVSLLAAAAPAGGSVCKSSGQSDLEVDARNCAERCKLFRPAAALPGATVPLSVSLLAAAAPAGDSVRKPYARSSLKVDAKKWAGACDRHVCLTCQ